MCTLNIDHEGAPTLGEVYFYCGEDIFNEWIIQPPCPTEIYTDNPHACPGYYIYLLSSMPATREVPVTLPSPVVWVTLEDCESEGNNNRCESPPALHLIGDEPITDAHILRIEGQLGNDPFSCEGDTCEIPLPDTSLEGVSLVFWAYSSYGDSSEVFNARVRVVLDENADRTSPAWYVDVLSPQWRGTPIASGAESWDIFPPVGGPPAWLSTPADVADLQTNFPYAYLAGKLIKEGVVYAGECEEGGLVYNGNASTCGIRVAQPAINEWQNRFDDLIMQAADDTQISAYLLKNLFARESQFWPGIFNDNGDFGLGQLTENGADTAFLWNPILYEQFCPPTLGEETCADGYLHLSEEDRDYLRSALVYNVNASCENCLLGLDLNQADFSVNVFAHTLLAACEQTGRIVQLNTGSTPANVSSYEDMWKFTLITYNAGAGCLGLAVHETSRNGDSINWENVSANLTEVCEGTKGYVEDISQ